MYLYDNEAEKIYSALFNKKIPESLRERFNNVSSTINSIYPEDEVKKYYDTIDSVSDLEALELVSRYRGKFTILSEKFKSMVYLAETIPDNYHVFINDRPQGIHAYVLIALSLVRTIVKLIKGFIISLVNRI